MLQGSRGQRCACCIELRGCSPTALLSSTPVPTWREAGAFLREQPGILTLPAPLVQGEREQGVHRGLAATVNSPRRQTASQLAGPLRPSSCPPGEVTASEQRVLAFPETKHSSLVLDSAKQVSAEPQYPQVACRTSQHRAKIPGPAAASAFPGRGTHHSPRLGCRRAEPFPGPRQRQMSHEISRPRRPARAAKCDSSIRLL